MGRLRLDVALALLAIVFANCVVQSQYYYVSDGPSLVLGPAESGESENSEVLGSEFMSRKGTSVEEEDADEADAEEDEESSQEQELHQQIKGRPRPIKLPSNFDEIVRRKMQLGKRQRRPLHGDPSPIHRGGEDDRKPESRLLWPFSIEVSKGGKEGWGPGHYGSYTAWASDGWGGGHQGPSEGWGGHHKHPYEHENEGWGEEEKGLTDEEIKKTIHYKKYQKKKKKIIKKLKKKLKFKRLIQKILQKHINYLDKIAPY